MGNSRASSARTMILYARLTAIGLAASACAGTPAASQPSPAASDQPGALDRAYIYEVRPEQEAPARERSVVEVSGTAEVDVPADRARAIFAVETRAPSAAAASSSNAETMDDVIAALRGSGVPGLEIETSGYALRPEYRMDQERVRQIDGYVALNNVHVTIDDVQAVGRVIDLAIGAGANRVAGLSFEAIDTEAARLEALRMAVERATAEARAIASALGRELGEPLEVRGGADVPGPPRPYEAASRMLMDAQAAPTPIEPGDQTVRATVSITFALGPASPGGR